MTSILIGYIATSLLFCLNVGQSADRVVPLEVNLKGRDVKYQATLPESLQRAFPSLKASGNLKERPTFIRGELADSILRRIQLARLSRYIDYRLPHIEKDRGKAEVHSHAPSFSAVIHGERLYIFSRVDLPGSVAVVNRLLQQLGVSVSNVEEARQIAELFILFYSDDFNTSGLMISDIEDVPQKYRADRPENTEKLRSIIHPLRVDRESDSYGVEFFTWENFPRGEVIRWQITVSPSGNLSVKQEIEGLI